MSQAPQVTYYCILTPQPPDVGSSVRPIARLLKEEDDVVRRKLLTQTYEVVARFAKKANAEGLRSQLHALGIETVILSDHDLRSFLFMWAKTANSGQGGMALKDFAEKPLYCPWEDVRGVMLMNVGCEDGSEAMLIDLHRKSTMITPRLDAAHFDFSALLQQRGATVEDFLAELESKTQIVVKRNFAEHRAELIAKVEDFGTAPGQFPPTKDALKSPYKRRELLAADFYSVVTALRTQQAND